MELRKNFLLMMLCMFVMGLGNAAFAEEVKGDAYSRPVMRDVMNTHGEIVEVNGNMVTIKGEGSYPLVTVILNEDTLLLDGRDGDLKGKRAVKKGRKITAYYSSKMTRSYPPQTQAFALVFGPNDEKQGKYLHVLHSTEAMSDQEGNEYVKVLDSNKDILVTVDKKACSDYLKIKDGERIMAWYNIVTMSLPGQTNASKVVILPSMQK